MEVMQNTIPNEDDRLSLSSYPMILFGFGEIFGCFFIGKIVDKYGSKKAGYANVLIMLCMAIITIIYCIIFQFGAMAYLMCFLWGF